MIKLEDITETRIAFSAPSCEDYIYLTPKEVIESIKELRKGLSSWHEFTGKSVDDPECH